MRILLALVMAAGTAITSTSAFAFDQFPHCDAQHVIERVIKRFNGSERYGLEAQITAIEHRSERLVEDFGLYPITRRFCRGKAYLADGHMQTIHYLIERQMGFAGVGYTVEFCLTGHDPWRVYGGKCRVLRR